MFDFFRPSHTWGTHLVLNSSANAWSLAWLSASCLRGRVALSMLGVEKMSAWGMMWTSKECEDTVWGKRPASRIHNAGICHEFAHRKQDGQLPAGSTLPF